MCEVPLYRIPVPVELLYRNVQRFRGGLVFKAHRPLYLSTLGPRLESRKEKGYYRGITLIENTHPPRIALGPQA
jgi:hypothetical protein